MFTAKPERLPKTVYPDEALLKRLRYTRLADADIPEHEFIQFRRLQALIYRLRAVGYDFEAMLTEAFVGALLFASIPCRLAATRCEFDLEVNDELLARLGARLPDDLIWLTTNATVQHERIMPLPIGISEYCGYSPFHAVIGDTVKLKSLIESHPRTEENLVLVNFSDRTFPAIRTPLRKLFEGQPFATQGVYSDSEAGYTQYVRGLRSHPFCLAPRGNGIDTHRMWECLYAGCIPIVQRWPAMRDFSELPILFVDRWEEACDEAVLKKTRDAFHRKTWDLRKLTLSYWYAKICELGKVDPAILQAARN